MDNKRSIVIGAVAGLILSIAFAMGFFMRDFLDIGPVRAYGTYDVEEPGYPLLDEVQNLLDQIYLREQPSYRERQYAAIRGLLSSLGDPNTFFIDPPVAASEAQVLAGTYGGIGVQLKRVESGAYALFPFPDGPAAKAGIRDGALLTAINGVAIDLSEGIDSLDQKLRGEVKEGNGVEISVLQAEEIFTTFIEFEVINVPSVVWRVLAEDERIGYIQIIRFTNRTPDELSEAAEMLSEAGISALVVDLRDNSGGLLQESVDVADEFLDGGVIVYDVRQNSERTYEATPGGKLTDIPLVVLVNYRSASASELVAGALQKQNRAVLIGQKTFGKGTVQQIIPLSDGSSVHITSAEWLTPDRNSLDGVGLEPNISMIPDENGRDIELGEAIRYLQATLEGITQ